MYRTDAEESLGPIEIQSTIIFDLVVLSQLANTSKAVIEVLLLNNFSMLSTGLVCTYYIQWDLL